MTDYKEDCIFCQIGAKKSPADIVFETDTIMFFRDIEPKAAVHLVGVPKMHIESIAHLQGEHKDVLFDLLYTAANLANEEGFGEGGFRLIANSGPDAGQQVMHLHWHVLAGEPLGPLRCK